MICPACGKGKLIRCTHNTTYTYKGESTAISIFGDHCKKCGETILDRDEAMRMSKQMKEFDKQVRRSKVTAIITSTID